MRPIRAVRSISNPRNFGLDVFSRAKTGIKQTGIGQTMKHLLIIAEMLRLDANRFFPLKPQPAEIFVDRIDISRTTAGLIDILNPKRIETLQLLIYLSMGWMCALEFSSLRAAMPAAGFTWLSVGGVAYTVGVWFYVLDGQKKLVHAHGIWHLFVLIGSASHFISILGFVR